MHDTNNLLVIFHPAHFTKRWIAKLKALVRDWAFSDYKWVTRASVIRIISQAKWENRDRLYVIRVLSDIQSQIK